MAQITVDVVLNGVYLVVVWTGAEEKRCPALNCALSLTQSPSFRVSTKEKVH
jgi:hypothetical protein